MSSGRPRGLVMLCTIATPGSRMRLLATRSNEMKSAELRISWSDSTISISLAPIRRYRCAVTSRLGSKSPKRLPTVNKAGPSVSAAAMVNSMLMATAGPWCGSS